MFRPAKDFLLLQVQVFGVGGPDAFRTTVPEPDVPVSQALDRPLLLAVTADCVPLEAVKPKPGHILANP